MFQMLPNFQVDSPVRYAVMHHGADSLERLARKGIGNVSTIAQLRLERSRGPFATLPLIECRSICTRQSLHTSLENSQ